MHAHLTYSAFCLLALLGTAASPATADVYSDNVVIVLDASGSMGNPMKGEVKMEAAKRAIGEVLRGVPESTQIGLLVFSGQGKTSDWVQPLGSRDDVALLNGLRPITAAGGTPLGAYIKIGADRLLQARERQLGYGTYRLLVVSDGQAGDPELMNAYTPNIVSKGIMLDVIGVDMRDRHTLANLARSYRRADDPKALASAIAEVLAEVSSSDDGRAGEEAFALLGAIPDEVAAAMLTALATPNNGPIQASGRGNPAQATGGGGGKPSPPVKDSGGKGSSSKKVQVFVMVFVFIAFMISRLRKRGGRRR